MIKNIALKLGDLSKTPNAWTVFTTEETPCITKKEALESLVEYLWAKFFYEHEEITKVKFNECCEKFLHLNPNAKFCSTCGNKLNFTFSLTDWYLFLTNLGFKTAEEYGLHDELYEYNYFGWSPWNYEFNNRQEEIIVIPDKAVELLTKVLFNVFPDLEKDLGFIPKYYINDLFNNLMDDNCVFLGNGYGRKISK